MRGCGRVQVDCDVGRPKVNYRETIQRRAEFDYLHKKQSGGSGARELCFLGAVAGSHPVTLRNSRLGQHTDFG